MISCLVGINPRKSVRLQKIWLGTSLACLNGCAAYECLYLTDVSVYIIFRGRNMVPRCEGIRIEKG
jgi:hypothetical protein